MPTGPTSTPHRRALALVLLLLTLLVLLAGCGSSSGQGTSTPTPRRTTSTSDSSTTVVSTAAAKQQVAEDYKAADKAFLDASAIPDPEFPAFVAAYTGPMLDQSTKVLKAFKLQGLVGRLPPNSKYRNDVDLTSMRINGDVAIFNVCAVDDSQRVEKASGRVVGGGGVDTSLVQAAMRRVDGVWRVAERKELQRWSGESGCAAR